MSTVTINLNFVATTPTGEPYQYNYPVGQWLAEQLEKRVSTDNPALEAYTAAKLRDNNWVITLPIDEALYIKGVVVTLDVDNLYKGQILTKFP